MIGDTDDVTDNWLDTDEVEDTTTSVFGDDGGVLTVTR